MISLKFIVGLLLLFLMLTGCGSGNTAGDSLEGTTSGASNGIVEGEMEPSLKQITTLNYEYKVKNKMKEDITLKFTSSQRVDYSIFTKSGEEVYLYSSTASFLAALGEEEILPGEEFTYDIILSDLSLPKGEYILTAWMTPKEGKKYKVHTNFSIE